MTRCRPGTPVSLIGKLASNRGPGSAAHHSASLHAAPRPGHATCNVLENKKAGTNPGHLQFQFSPKPQAHTAEPIHCCSFCFGAAPTWREAISPFLNIIKVVIDMMPYLAAVFEFSSTLSLTILTLSPSAPAISSSAGA